MAFVDPATVVVHFGLRSGNKVADFGCGRGEFIWPMAEIVGVSGKIYALDVQKDLLGALAAEAKVRNIQSVEIVWSDIDRPSGSGLADNLMDVVLLSNVLFQVHSPYTTMLEAKRILKQGGQLVVIDWAESFGNMGPRAEKVITETQAKDIALEAGFTFERTFPAGAHHYGLTFIKSISSTN